MLSVGAWRLAGLAVLVMLTALTSTGCQLGTPMGPMHPDMHGPRGGASARAPSPSAGAQELVIVATEFAFDPDKVRIDSGQTVNLILANRGATYHDLTIADLGFVLTAEAGTRGTGALTVAEPGRYRIVCSVAGHADAGMIGTLIVD